MTNQLHEFKKLAFDDLNVISKHLELINPKICELSMANIFMWSKFDNPHIAVINENLCVQIKPENEESYFLEPIGNSKLPETIEVCLKHAKKFSRISEHFVSHFDRSKYNIFPLRAHFDYIYLTKELAELKGKKYDGKRNHIKKFQKYCPNYEFARLSPEHKKSSLEIFEKWFSAKSDTKYFTKLSYDAQRNAIEYAFLNIERLRLDGGVMIYDNKLLGFIIGSPLNKNTISMHFSYGQPDIRGIWQILLWEACNKIFRHSTHINLEQDLGIPGLRTAKLSYHPHKLEEKFEIEPKI